MKNCKILDWCLIFLATLSLIYFLVLINSSYYNTLYTIYPIFSLLVGSYGIYEFVSKTSILARLPKVISYLIKGLIVIGLVVFVSIESLIIKEANSKYDKASDYVIVLGSRLYGKKPAPLLRYRLEAAVDYHQKNPHTFIIVSGGQGHGEKISEAKAMKDYLVARGVDESLIIEEDKSTNTSENIRFSKQIIESRTKENYDVVIITNGFHCYRSVWLAKNNGINVHSYGAKESMNLAPHYYLREFFGCLKDMIMS